MPVSPLLIKLDEFIDLCIKKATYNNGDDIRWSQLRRELLSDSNIASNLPDFVHRYPSPDAFRLAMQREGGYAERRERIWSGFKPLVEHVESSSGHPMKADAENILKTINSDTVEEYWRRALERRESDFEGAITMARTLLETVCKHILHDFEVSDYDAWDLPRLYRETALKLNLAPDQHQEEIFRQILGGSTSIVQGLSGLRNRLSDAHGRGPHTVRPARRHAEFAVNVSGAVATFLVSTWQARNEGK